MLLRLCVVFAVVLISTIAPESAVEDCRGCLSLDEFNFEKIVTKFKAVLVKFDIMFPYGDKQDHFSKFAAEVADNNDIVVAQVGIKDYGNKDNEELGKTYGIKSKEDLPVVKLFLGSADNPLTFKDEFIVHNLRNFVSENAGIYVRLPGCLQEYDKLAREFMKSDDKADKFKEIEALPERSNDEEKTAIKTYLLFMSKIVELGVDFIKNEKHRLNKIIKEGKIHYKKKHELTQRLNILHAFKQVKDEL